MAGIYLHIPFCNTRCIYCDFCSCTDTARKPALLHALGRELEARRDFLQDEPVRTIYFGGGTPSLCTSQEIAGLLERMSALYDLSGVEEVTLEANPDDLAPERLAGLAAARVNRLSIGVQSLRDDHLRWMRRRHTASQAVAAVRQARRSGFGNLSIDLIYGLPGMRLPEWDEQLRRAVDLGAEHISAYLLTVEPATELGRLVARGEVSEAAPDAARAQFDMLRERLAAAGYEHYEVSNWARPGFRSRHNSAYWTDRPYLGVGPSAHSYDGCVRRWNTADLDAYLERMPHEEEMLSGMARYNEYVMTGLRTADGVNASVITERFGTRYSRYFTARAEKFAETGLLRREGDRYRIPARHFFVSDGIISDLFFA